jgi:hypothetical protein
MSNDSKEILRDLNKKIQHVYIKAGYFDRYGGDVLITSIVFIIFTLIFIYYQIRNNLESLRANWDKNKCDPRYIPFAGLINKPTNTDSATFTYNNFKQCTNSILANLMDGTNKELLKKLAQLQNVGDTGTSSQDTLRNALDTYKTYVDKVGLKSEKNQSELAINIFKFGGNMKGFFSKFTGVANGILYGLQAILLTFISLVITVFKGIIALISIFITVVIVIALIAAISIVGIPLAVGGWLAIGIVVAATITLSLSLGGVFQNNTDIPGTEGFKNKEEKKNKLKKRWNKIKNFDFIKEYKKFYKMVSNHACFGKDTELKLKSGEKIKISEIKVGDILHDGSKVTAWLELSIAGEEIYKLNDIVVTGNHRLYDEEKGFIYVKNHTSSYNYNDYNSHVIYCINTDSKKIVIDDIIFTDWDDLDEMTMVDITNNCEHILPNKFTKKDIHTYLDSGFAENTMIELEYGKSVKISEVEVDDILKFGERVVGKIVIDSSDMNSINQYHLDGTIINGSSNLNIFDNNLGIKNTSDMNGNPLLNETKLYHLLTESGIFNIDGIYFQDYNSSLENFIEGEMREGQFIYL